MVSSSQHIHPLRHLDMAPTGPLPLLDPTPGHGFLQLPTPPSSQLAMAHAHVPTNITCNSVMSLEAEAEGQKVNVDSPAWGLMRGIVKVATRKTICKYRRRLVAGCCLNKAPYWALVSWVALHVIVSDTLASVVVSRVCSTDDDTRRRSPAHALSCMTELSRAIGGALICHNKIFIMSRVQLRGL